MIKRIHIILALLLLSSVAVFGQDYNVRQELADNPDRYGGSSAPYEYLQQAYTPSPKGYRPFYISYFGRHGSRNHSSVETVESLYKTFKEADSLKMLTPLGTDVLGRITSIEREMRGHFGELTNIGVKEQQAIAARMYSHYPSAFGKGIIVAQSTTTPRVIHSMESFCASLKEEDPSIVIIQESSEKTSAYLNHYTPSYTDYYKNGPWREIRDKWIQDKYDATRLIQSLFTQNAMFDGNSNGHKARQFSQDLFSLAKIMPASGLGISLYDLFTENELYVLWENGNMDQYMRKSTSGIGGKLSVSIAKPLLQDFISKADEHIVDRTVCADLRFGHGEGIMPLAGLMQIEEASRVTSDPDLMSAWWQDWRVTTMSSNIQWIFYENKHHEILIKILLNEREAMIPVKTSEWPYYCWTDVKEFYNTVLNDAAQVDLRKKVNSTDFRQLYNVYYINSYDDVPQTKAPKGYKPFYLSHYGRHGARYQSDEKAYTGTLAPLAKAHQENELTQYGESFYQRAEAYYGLCRGRAGELTELGWQQHRKIAHSTFKLYPQIFTKGAEIFSSSSESHRCIMSMESFCLGLKECLSSLNIYSEVSPTLLDETNPTDKSNVNYVDGSPLPSPWNINYTEYFNRKVSDQEALNILLRIFKDENYISKNINNARNYSQALYNFVSGMDCLGTGYGIEDLFTVDELFDFYEVINYGYFEWGALQSKRVSPVVKCIVEDAEKDMKAGHPVARLRFGHDTIMQGVLHLLKIEQLGVVPVDADNLSMTWHCWLTPMASTLNFVFYHSNSNPDILFKVTLNGKEVPMNILKPTQGPYYKWSDFKSWAENNI